jgi:hypothetical protein
MKRLGNRRIKRGIFSSFSCFSGRKKDKRHLFISLFLYNLYFTLLFIITDKMIKFNFNNKKKTKKEEEDHF